MYLNCHSYHSLRYGVLSPEVLVRRARALGIDVLVLTDINTTSGVYDFVKACRAAGITPLVGIEFRNGNRHLYTGIARSFEGFGELNRFLSQHLMSGSPLPERAPVFDQAWVIYPFEGHLPEQFAEHEFIGVRHRQLNRLLRMPLQAWQSRLLLWQPVTFGGRGDWDLHRHLRAVDKNALLNHLRAEDLASEYDWLVPPERLQAAFSAYPFLLANSEALLKSCSFDFDFSGIKNKQNYTGSRAADARLLEQLAVDGLEQRYGKGHAEARERVSKELGIINQLGFAAYFLIAWDMVRYSLSRGFYHVGRGSGANSVVAYCLRITDVDPIELNLYFERFLNPKRTSPPDFDIDYSWRDRDAVQHYLFKRYGQEHVALLGAMSTFQRKAGLRELGKVFGLPKEEIDLLINDPANDYNKNNISTLITTLGKQMNNFPNLRTIHAGGILISEDPITCYTALDLPPKGFPTTHWDMYIAEDMGFEKLDILSQRGIGHIKEAVEIIQENRDEEVDVHKVNRFFEDEKVKQQLKSGETTGCFYIESPAMRGLLKKLKCSDYITLVAASSIIRPGVAKSGMMKEYIRRFHNPGDF